MTTQQAATPEAGYLDGQDLLHAVRAIAQGPLARIASAVDREGTYPEEVLRSLGAAGAWGVHHERQAIPGMGDQAADFGTAIKVGAEISRVCGATGFMAWCHQVCGLYLEQSGNPHLTGSVLEHHAKGLTLGGTGMSNPMKTYAGIEQFLLKAQPDGEGFRVTGTLPWVSNIGLDHYFGVLAQVNVAPGEAAREIMFVVACDAPGVTLRNCPSFSAMEGTNTWAVRLEDFRVDASNLLADPARPFIGRIRGAFVLLQMGMALGVTQGAIDSMLKDESRLGHVNRFLDDRPETLQAELDALTDTTMRLSRTPFCTDTDFLIEVLDTRAKGAQLALRAAQSALLHAGARGYLMSSDVQRRVRESHFVAIVTPAIKHLRKEIDRLRGQSTLTAQAA
jgi:alkylation response protein AidB-like acyl-CoA dehydrogenase